MATTSPRCRSRWRTRELRQRIQAGRFLTTIYDIDLEGKKHRVIPRDFHLDPVKDFPIHVDFMRLGEGATIRISVPLHVQRAESSPGVKRGGTVNIVTHTIDIECSADNIPQAISKSMSRLARDRPFAASVRHHAAEGRSHAARGPDPGHHRAAVRLRRRAEGGGCGRGWCCGRHGGGPRGWCGCSGGRRGCCARGWRCGARGRCQGAGGGGESPRRRWRQEEVMLSRGMPRHAALCRPRQSRREIRA